MMGTKKMKWLTGSALIVGILSSGVGLALVTMAEKGTWPDSWPKELEPFRGQARSVGVAHGIQEDVYEIRFDKREDFEKAWPAILTLKDKGAPLTLSSIRSTYGRSGTTAETGVRILCPALGSGSRRPDGKELKIGPPWSDLVKPPSGEMPEYVVQSADDKWIPFDGTNRLSFIYRARTDIELICDGKIVDLNRIRFPADTPIIDRRKLGDEKANAKPE